jgi:septal ring factor EnvC (AmiA/AmiB activator)
MAGDKNDINLTYILADYKQLVLQYKGKYSDQVKKATFWTVTAFWLSLGLVCMAILVISLAFDANRGLSKNQESMGQLGRKIELISNKLDKTHQELMFTKEELNKKDMLIERLERNASSASKRIIEELLKEE